VSRRIWLDMANSPHPVLFRSLSKEMCARGHELALTVRDHGQTRDLTLATWPEAQVIGGESPGSRAANVRALTARAVGLRRWAAGRPIDVAVSLNSYAQIFAARLAGIPAITLMDYEYQPANHLSFRLARRIAVPSVFPSSRLRRYGASEARVIRFDGFKEEFYLDADYEEDASPLFASDGRTRVLLRPPAEGSLYHPLANPAFDELVVEAARRPDLEVVLLPRLSRHRERYAALDGVRIVEQAVDGLAALASADVFIGAGGTMSREAALLGLRAYTMLGAQLPAVDRALMERGRLHDLRRLDLSAADLSPRDRTEREETKRLRHVRGDFLRRWLVDAIEGVHRQAPGTGPRPRRARA
jgi:uncharacterized protein